MSFDNTSIRIIYERNDFILDQCALQGSPESEVTLLWENPVMIRIRIQEIFDFNPHAFAFPQFSFNIIESSLFLKLAHFFRQFIANCYLIQSIYYLIQIKYLFSIKHSLLKSIKNFKGSKHVMEFGFSVLFRYILALLRFFFQYQGYVINIVTLFGSTVLHNTSVL